MTKNIFLLPLVACMLACGGKGSSLPETTQENDSTAAVMVQTTDDKSLKVKEERFSFETKNVKVELLADFPTDGNAVLTNAIAEFINETLGGTYQGPLTDGQQLLNYYGENSQKELLDMAKEMKDNNLPDADQMQLYSYTRLKKHYETDRYVTYSSHYETFTGGAHGMHGDASVTLRKSDGRRFTSQDMFRSITSTKLQKLMKEGLRTYFTYEGEQAPTDEALAELLHLEGYYSIDYLPMPQYPPYMDKDGIHFVYQPYEIAAYAAGEPAFTLNYKDAKPLLSRAAAELIP